MTRDEFVWALIRFSGVVLLVMSIAIFVPTIPLAISMMSAMDEQDYAHTLDQKSQTEVRQASKRAALSNALFVASPGFPYCLIGLYFLLGGKWVFKLITRPS